jgi:DNA-binding CsgD family transcriptional regulator
MVGFPETGAAAESRGHDPELALREWLERLTGKTGVDLDSLIDEGTAEGAATELAETERAVHDLSRVSIRASRQAGQLTVGQVTTLRFAADGLTAQEIADAMSIRPDTVKENLQVSRKILGARNTAHAVRLAIREGLIAA